MSTPRSNRKRTVGGTLEGLLSPLLNKANKRKKATEGAGGEPPKKKKKTAPFSATQLEFSDDEENEPVNTKGSMDELAAKVKQFDTFSKSVQTLEDGYNNATAAVLHQQKLKQKADDEHEEVFEKKQAAIRMVESMTEAHNKIQDEIKKMHKNIRLCESRQATLAKKKIAAEDVAHDPNAINHSSKMKQAASETLEQALENETRMRTELQTYDGPKRRLLKSYSKLSGQDIFEDWGLKFCYSTGKGAGGLSKDNLKTARKALKTFGYPAAEHVSLNNGNKCSVELWNEICTIVGIAIPKQISEEVTEETKCARSILHAFRDIAKERVVIQDFDDEKDGSDEE
jgi:hypothetical protein